MFDFYVCLSSLLCYHRPFGNKKQINKREKSIETRSVTDGNRQMNEGNEKIESNTERWKPFSFFTSVLLLCFTSLSKKTAF